MNLPVNPEGALRARLSAAFSEIRAHTLTLASSLSSEDQGLQSMPDASPTKWHLAHTTWFFETLVLCPHVPGYAPRDHRYFELFNSYYEALGPRHPRPRRGLLSRPTLAEIHAYRAYVEEAVLRLLQSGSSTTLAAVSDLLMLGIHHEQQHQELLLTDIKHAFSCNPLLPAWREARLRPSARLAMGWQSCAGGLVEIGHAGDGFAFDNETPRHRTWLEPYLLATRPVTVGEYQAFIADGGYRTPALWLSEGFELVAREGWNAPAYWMPSPEGEPGYFTLHGWQALDPEAPVTHVSFHEAHAYAAWAGARLPTEAEWEHAVGPTGLLARMALDAMHPRLDAAAPGDPEGRPGEVWEWTASAYTPYPGFRAPPGAIGEYNGKFMVNQIVLRGGSCASPGHHVRASYRNFFPASARWQFSGLRLARDAT